MPPRCRLLPLLTLCLGPQAAFPARADEAAAFRLEQAGVLRLPADVRTPAGATAPLTGLSGLAWLGDDHWVAAVDNSDVLATFTLTLGPEGEPTRVADVKLRPLQSHHDYEDVAVCPPPVLAGLTAAAGLPSPAPPAAWLLLCEEDTPALRLFALADGRELGAVPLPPTLRACRPNRGLESVAIDSAAGCVWTATEEATPTDGPAATEAAGTVVRLTRIAIAATGGKPPGVRQFAYAVDPPHEAVRAMAGQPLSGVVALVPVGGERLLVMERSFVSGLPPFENRVYLVDTGAAPDVAGVAGGLALRPAATRVTRRLIWKGVLGANLEGLAAGPPLANGRRTLVAVADNGGTNVPTLLVTYRLTSPRPATTP